MRWALAVLALGLLVWAAWSRLDSPGRVVGAPLELGEILGPQPDDGFARAEGPRELVFPADHGPHPSFRNEWWYFTGNLSTAAGRRFGYQLTFFRTSLTPAPQARASAWGASEMYMAHFAVSDIEAQRFDSTERYARGAAGLADAQATPFGVYLEDWSARAVAAGRTWPMRLVAAHDDFEIELRVAPERPLVLQGDRGWSPKTADGSSASHYYSGTRLGTSGRVRVGDGWHDVEGLSWLDREWSSAGLGREQVGWDWFALQLDDGTDLMWYRLRAREGSADFAMGKHVAPNGDARTLDGDALRVEATGTWVSPHTDTAYPAGWRLRMPDSDLELDVEPLIADQELHGSVRYWEGAVRASGRIGTRRVRGYGYVELTGY